MLRLSREARAGGLGFYLDEECLPRPLEIEYDSGDVDEWIEPYLETARVETLCFLGAFRDRRAVGLLSWSKLDWNETVWLLDIRVSEPERRRGVGASLLRWLQTQARAMDVRGIFVETQTSNLPAVRFYRKHGFQIVGFNDHFYENVGLETGNVALFLFWETCPGSTTGS